MADAYRIIISPEASADLWDIHAFIAHDSPDNAAGMVERILTAIDSLKTAPHRTVLEHQSRKIEHPVRTLPIRPYIIFFRVLDHERIVRILTIRHGAWLRPRRFD